MRRNCSACNLCISNLSRVVLYSKSISRQSNVTSHAPIRSWQCRGRNDLMDILSAHRRKEGKKDTKTKSAADAKPIHVQGAVALGDSCWNCGKQGNLRTCAACTKVKFLSYPHISTFWLRLKIKALFKIS